ncbi:MAG TPA: D-glycero-beta-D-manno-heptose 1,7-bisphosphate 7-phosphatase [Rhizomicrobium sp.]
MNSGRAAIFLDRDGVLNVDRGYVYRPQDFEWISGAIAAVRRINEEGYLAIVVTNQSGIARQYYSEADFLALTHWMNDTLASHGAHIDAVYHCPHHPEGTDAKFAVDCDCRKPKPGLLHRAIRDLNVAPQRSFLIGNEARDLEAAKAAGLRSYLFEGGNLDDFLTAVLRREAG